MNKHDEIKKLLKSSRMLLSNKTSLNEISEIRKQYGIITEQDISTKLDVGKSIERSIGQDMGTNSVGRSESKRDNDDEKTQGYRILNGLMFVKGSTDAETTLTEDEKEAFKETMQEFVNEVSGSVDFEPLVLYPKKVVWSGFLTAIGVKFTYISDDDVYLSLENESEDEDELEMGINLASKQMIRVDEEYEEVIKNLRAYFKKFQSKWQAIIADRKKTKVPSELGGMSSKSKPNKLGFDYETF